MAINAKSENGLKKKKETSQINSISVLPGIIVLAYLIIPTYTPNLMALDSNASKFLSLSFLNLFSFIILISSKHLRTNNKFLPLFINSRISLVYFGFLLVSCLSLIVAINLTEGLLNISRIISVFAAVFILTFIIAKDPRTIKWVIIPIVLMLLYDSLTVFYNIGKYIQGELDHIYDIKAIYGNKNMIASAIFLKLPAALYVILFDDRRIKRLGWLSLITGITAVLFLVARTFYIGLILLTVIFVAQIIIEYLQTKKKNKLRLLGYYLLALIIAYLAFTGTQQYLYPQKENNRHTQGVSEQLASISPTDYSAGERLKAWKWSWELFRKNPLLGIGSGNWKIQVLKYENKEKADYRYFMNAHNDFIEIFTETGVVGGLLYIGIFIFVISVFLKNLFNVKSKKDYLNGYLFLAGLGIISYGIDAFFNFPADRPEILILFSLYLSIAITVIYYINSAQKNAIVSPEDSKKKANISGFRRPLMVLTVLLLSGILYITYLNFESSKMQRMVFEEIRSGSLKRKSQNIISGYPRIPSITIFGEPVKVQQARYLLNEGKNTEALQLLRTDHSSPWDGRKEYFMAMGFNALKQNDSVWHYAQKLIKIKPNYFKYLSIVCNLLEEREEYEQVSQHLKNYLSRNKKIVDAWLYTSNFYDRINKLDSAWKIINEAKENLPNDTLIEKQFNYIYNKKFREPNKDHYSKALELVNQKEFKSALDEINLYIDSVKEDLEAHQLRAYLYFYLENYVKCTEEINFVNSFSSDTMTMFKLRQTCAQRLQIKD